MSLAEIFARFEEPGWLPDGVLFVGPDRRDDTARPPRISWEPATGLHTKPRRLGGGPGDDGEIMQRQWGIKVEIWGNDLTETEKLANVFLGAAHELLSGAGYNGGQEIWRPGGTTAKGSVCEVLFHLLTPVPRLPKPTRPITAIVGTPVLVTS